MNISLPFVSVIMPIRNEEGFIARSLGAVLDQDYPAEKIEILIVDGLSSDRTRDIVREMSDSRVRLLDNPQQIVPYALNQGIAAASGEIIVRVDGHCEIAPDYIRRCVAHLQEDGVDGVGGPLETIGETPIAGSIAVAMSSGFGVGGSAFRTTQDKTMLVDTVAFPAYTRQALAAAGPFDEEFVRNQDDEYNYRLRKMGRRILLAADVKARYYSRSSLRKLGRQYYQYGFWKVRVLQKHPGQMQPRQFVPPLFVAALLGSGLLALFKPLGRIFFAAAAGSYLLANLLASLLTARQAGREHLPRLPFIFAILHLSYGWGFLVGLVRFFNRWPET